MKTIKPLSIILLALTMASCKKATPVIELPYYTDSSFTPHWRDDADGFTEPLHTIPSFELINQEGKTITNSTFDGGVYVANFFFTSCPTVCPKMRNNLFLIQEEFMNEDRVKLLSHSVMPWADSVSRLQEYALMNDVQPNKWHLVTGERDNIYALGRTGYFADEGFGKGLTELNDFLHTENLILIDKNRHIRGIYNGTLRLEAKRLIADIHQLLKEG